MGHANLFIDDKKKRLPDFILSKSRSVDSNADHVLFEMNKPRDVKNFKDYVLRIDQMDTIDVYAEQYAELLLSKNAQLYRANIDVQRASIKEAVLERYKDTESWMLGSWVFYPWSGKMVHILGREEFEELRTVRNHDLITREEQAKLADFSIACAGMSVGSASAIGAVISGISHKIKIADGAVISGSNLNRIMTGVHSVGTRKDMVIARLLYEMNPYISVHKVGAVTDQNIGSLFDSPWKTELLVDEIDDLQTKVRMRVEARKRKIPVIMATELGDSIMLDVERFDLEPNRPVFHGKARGIEDILDNGPDNHREWMKMAVEIIGPQNMPLRMQQSLLKIGSSIVTHPQLGSTVMATGGVIAFAIKQIALGQELPSQRNMISMSDIFQPGSKKFSQKRRHAKHTKTIKRAVSNF